MNSLELKEFRKERNLSQHELAELIGKSVRAIQSWEQGVRAMPQSVDLLLKSIEPGSKGLLIRLNIAKDKLGLSYSDLSVLFNTSLDETKKAFSDLKYLKHRYIDIFVKTFNISRTWLNTGNGDMNGMPPEFLGNLGNNGTELLYSELHDEKSQFSEPELIRIRLITPIHREGFFNNYYADVYLNTLPVIFIEKNVDYKGAFIAFEVNGDSMEPEYRDGDIVICNEVRRDLWKYKLHKDDSDYFIAHGTRGLFFKEIKKHDVYNGDILCHSLSDNENEKDFNLNLKEVIYLYRIIEHRRTIIDKRRWLPRK